jgi:hypothetical protein
MIALDPSNARRAIDAYDMGARFEREFSLQSTYNLVNQLVVRFLAQPGYLSNLESALIFETTDGQVTDTVGGWLRSAEERVDGGLSKRPDVAWGLADLVLLGAIHSSNELESRLVKFEKQVQSDRDNYPFTSLNRVVQDLVRVSTPESPAGAGLRQLAAWLEARQSR